jgi:hypothetical protein|tara:strand:+ start:26 stop:454 length:429 start_codon:yes stop_codon:yes gene_type:complete
MANRSFNRAQALDKEVKFLFLEATIGSGGDPTLVENKSVGIKSISDSAVGEYDITLGIPGGDSDKYPALLYAQAILLEGDAIGTDGGISFQIEAETVSSDGVIKLFAIRDTGAIADPPSGSVLKMMIVVKNSNLAGVGSGDI